MISLIWTKSNKIGSKIIRSVTDGKSSHFAILMDSKIVFHSNFKGCHLEWFQSFLKSNEIVYRIDLNLLTQEQEEQVYQQIINKYDLHKYDFGAMLYLGVSLLLKKLNIQTENQNLWASKSRYMCIELVNVLKIFNVNLPNIETTTPDLLFSNLEFYLRGKLYK